MIHSDWYLKFDISIDISIMIDILFWYNNIIILFDVLCSIIIRVNYCKYEYTSIQFIYINHDWYILIDIKYSDRYVYQLIDVYIYRYSYYVLRQFQEKKKKTKTRRTRSSKKIKPMFHVLLVSKQSKTQLANKRFNTWHHLHAIIMWRERIVQ